MKKNNLTLIVFLIVGLLAGTILARLLADVPWLSFLTKSAEIRWEPKADLQVVRYDLKFAVTLNLASILGLAGAFWIYRKV
ncbi:DUF4321 domain-containing protein [Paenibacillus antri]|uniref:DUF4321 domain-containing protein n=1 Tax=Paenibacillus antri TaxID=2582848 RepID=A0A5R9GNA4_9BACL|nr:DUF4321 domain-containing protein [Paenibacillus antri]TLS53525.1 DUF4321 domain-containing protein [Paenibacillus antri]